jgi:hypothetical protein
MYVIWVVLVVCDKLYIWQLPLKLSIELLGPSLYVNNWLEFHVLILSFDIDTPHLSDSRDRSKPKMKLQVQAQCRFKAKIMNK